MQNWTDKIIHWNQLPGTEVKRLLATWGKPPADIAKYDKKHGFVNATPKSVAPMPTAVHAKADKPTKAPAKTVTAKPVARQKHTGADGEIKFVAHRNLYVGFMGGRVVVTKRTVDACRVMLLEQFRIEAVKIDN